MQVYKCSIDLSRVSEGWSQVMLLLDDCMTNITEHEHSRHATRPNPPQQHDITVFFYSNQRASESRVVQRVHTAAAYCPLVTES